MTKLHTDSRLALSTIKERTDDGTRVVFVSGNFNIVHPGHLRLLRYAAERGDFLVVGVHDDGHPGVMLPEDLRLEGVAATSWVDFAFVLRDSPADFIDRLKPDIVVKGREHEAQANPEQAVLDPYGGKLLFSSGDISFSSIDLLQQEFRKLNVSTIRPANDFIQRHAFASGDLETALSSMKTLKIVVFGDLIVDEYISCDALGMSQEDPTIVVTPVMQEKFVGGAGIVAAHARGLGAEVTYIGICGDDETGRFAEQELRTQGVNALLTRDETRPTTLKQRFRAENKTLLRVNHLRQTPIRRVHQQQILDQARAVVKDCDLVIFADFNYGCLPQELFIRLSDIGASQDVMMVADSQSSSQIGDVSRFKGMRILTPTEREARLALQNFTDGLVVIAENLKQKAQADNVILTLGPEGVLIHAAAHTESGFATDRLPSLNSAPKDVSGAGDSLLTCSAMAMATGTDIWQSVYLGSLAAACQVGKLGNVPLTTGELQQEIDFIRRNNL